MAWFFHPSAKIREKWPQNNKCHFFGALVMDEGIWWIQLETRCTIFCISLRSIMAPSSTLSRRNSRYCLFWQFPLWARSLQLCMWSLHQFWGMQQQILIDCRLQCHTQHRKILEPQFALKGHQWAEEARHHGQRQQWSIARDCHPRPKWGTANQWVRDMDKAKCLLPALRIPKASWWTSIGTRSLTCSSLTCSGCASPSNTSLRSSSPRQTWVFKGRWISNSSMFSLAVSSTCCALLASTIAATGG